MLLQPGDGVMHFVHVEGRRYAQFERLRARSGGNSRVLHAAGGCGPAYGGGRGPSARLHDGTMAVDLGLAAERLHYCQQVHETHIAVVGRRYTRGLFAELATARLQASGGFR